MNFTLEIIAGRHAGARYALDAGRPLTIGRSPQASLSFPDDSFLSGTHFSIEAVENNAVIRDLKSTNGTFVNGQRITEMNVRPGDVIGAGSLEFHILRQVPAPAANAPSIPPKSSFSSELPVLNYLRATGAPVYCLLDAACDPNISSLVAMASEPVQCLYNGQSAIELAAWAPYLAELPLHSKLAAMLLTEGWGKGWASYFISRHPLEELRYHFRKFLLIRLDDGSEAYFRFYDPRVLRDFLPTSTRNEVWEFFGPVEKWVIESPDAGVLLEMTHEYGTLKTAEIPIKSLT